MPKTAQKKGTEEGQSRNLHELNVMSTEWGICLSSTRIDEKGNEIPEMQKAIKGIDCRGCIPGCGDARDCGKKALAYR